MSIATSLAYNIVHETAFSDIWCRNCFSEKFYLIKFHLNLKLYKQKIIYIMCSLMSEKIFEFEQVLVTFQSSQKFSTLNAPPGKYSKCRLRQICVSRQHYMAGIRTVRTDRAVLHNKERLPAEIYV